MDPLDIDVDVDGGRYDMTVRNEDFFLLMTYCNEIYY